MKSYNVTTNDVETLQAALGRMIEYSKFLAEDGGSDSRVKYIDDVLRDYNIDVGISEY